MPIDYLSNKPYCIDYQELYREIMKNRILKNYKLQSDYIKLWMSELQKCDKAECEQFNDIRFKELILKESIEAPEKYRYEIEYGVQKVNIFFRVSRLIQILGNPTDDMIQYFSLDEFIKDNCYIKWDKTEIISELKTFPILMAPITVDKYIKLVVIDGNHRLTSWIKKNKKNIPCVILDGQALVDNNMFASAFSKLLYIFQNEMVAMATYSIRDNIDDMTLIGKSYFKTGKMLYDV